MAALSWLQVMEKSTSSPWLNTWLKDSNKKNGTFSQLKPSNYP
jgi:hypothetical protein